MALRSGLAAQLGVAAETTFGTRVVPDHFYEINSESMKLNRKRASTVGIRTGKLFNRSQRFRTTQYDVTGDIELEAQANTQGLLWKHALGSSSISADGLGYLHTYTVADTYGLSLTAQVGTPGVGGTVQVREYNGCKIDSWDLAASLDKPLSFKVSLDGQAENLAQTLAAASWASNTYNEVFYADEVAFTIAGSTVLVKDFSISGKNNYKTDRFFLGQQTKAEQIRHAYVEVTGKITAEFTDYTLYNHYVNDDVTGSLVVTCTGQKTYDTAKKNRLIITIPVCRYDGDTPNVKGPDVLDQDLMFTALDDDTQTPVTVALYTSDATD